MNSYQAEQLESIEAVRRRLLALPLHKKAQLTAQIGDYLGFRRQAAAFLTEHFSDICTRTCYQNRLSACCSKDGIITFFGDVVVNLLLSEPAEIDRLTAVLNRENHGFKCVYLAEGGCLWRVKPIVCEMFLCDAARDEVFGNNPDLNVRWREFEETKKQFTWPDRPVLFDDLEKYFMDLDCRTALMYLHNSPGLLRVKKIAREKGEFYDAR
ncbi:MAG: hypothetical protein ACLFQY_16540 [Desulfococcaceae bacterium]